LITAKIHIRIFSRNARFALKTGAKLNIKQPGIQTKLRIRFKSTGIENTGLDHSNRSLIEIILEYFLTSENFRFFISTLLKNW
jgi:hypothetical protein